MSQYSRLRFARFYTKNSPTVRSNEKRTNQSVCHFGCIIFTYHHQFNYDDLYLIFLFDRFSFPIKNDLFSLHFRAFYFSAFRNAVTSYEIHDQKLLFKYFEKNKTNFSLADKRFQKQNTRFFLRMPQIDLEKIYRTDTIHSQGGVRGDWRWATTTTRTLVIVSIPLRFRRNELHDWIEFRVVQRFSVKLNTNLGQSKIAHSPLAIQVAPPASSTWRQTQSRCSSIDCPAILFPSHSKRHCL